MASYCLIQGRRNRGGGQESIANAGIHKGEDSAFEIGKTRGILLDSLLQLYNIDQN